MGVRVAVAGASGYAGGELLRLLAGHPGMELAAALADGNAGKTIGEVHPHLAGEPALAHRVFEPAGLAGPAGTAGTPFPDLAGGCDLVFLALPAGQSALAAARIPAGTAVVDLGPDFRLADPAAWRRHYPGEHPGRWLCGLPELPGGREAIRSARRVAVPGCYATAAILALTPLVATGLVSTDDVVIMAASGTSGAGRTPRADLLASEVMGSVSAYAVAGAHRHTPEIMQALDAAAGQPGTGQPGAGRARVSFTPLLAPMPRGILAICTALLADPATSAARLRAALADAYAGHPFACLLPEDRWPATAAVAGSNGVHLQVAADLGAGSAVATGRAVVAAAIDNLGKGAAGQAVQNANLMLGLPETAGLTASGVAP